MIDYCELAVPGVRALQPYQPGKPIEELQRELGLSEVIKLASNENPLGPSPLALEAIHRQLKELARYPDGNGFELKNRLSQQLSVTPAQITLGNGSNDVLEMIARAFVQPGEEVIFSQYAFAVYPIVSQAVGAEMRVIPAVDWGHDLVAMQQAVTDRTRVIFIANPNNPTGTWLTQPQIESFLATIPQHVLVVLDEAYFEYASHAQSGIEDFADGLTLLDRHPNLIVTRTFSKAYGLAGLRVGYAIASAAITNILNRVRQPFNVNLLGLSAASAVLDDSAYLEQGIRLNQAGMQYIQAELTRLQLSYIPSAGNFVSFSVARDAGPVYQALLQSGVIVRPVANYGMPQHLRVSIGSMAENQQFIHALTQVLSVA